MGADSKFRIIVKNRPHINESRSLKQFKNFQPTMWFFFEHLNIKSALNKESIFVSALKGINLHWTFFYKSK